MNRSTWLTAVLFTLTVVALPKTPATAQPPEVRAQVAEARARMPQTLAEVVSNIVWDPTVRGPLIVVAPEKARRPFGPDRRPMPLEGGENGITVNALASYFDFRLIPCGSVSVFAPATMKVLATRLPRPDIIGSMSRGDRLAYLQGSFTERQWRQIGSEQGLGANELTGRQRELFLSLLPDPMVVSRMVADASGKATTQQVTLTSAQRASARISLRKRVAWGFPVGKDGNGTMTVGTGDRVPNSESLEIMPDPRFYMEQQGKIFGVAVVDEQRARLKAGDLPFDWNALNPEISLTGAKTVGDLIERVRQVTRVELYCDRRYAELPVVLWGSSGRAGDVLTTLCYGVTGAFRKVGNTFILTDDREGLAIRVGRIEEWVQSARSELSAIQKEMRAGQAARPADLVQWDGSDPTSADAGLVGKINDFQKRNSAMSPEERNKPENRNLTIPVTDLPSDARFLAEKQAETAVKIRPPSENNQFQVRTDVVQLRTEEISVIVIPGIGVVRMQELAMRRLGAGDQYTPPAPSAEPKPVEMGVADRALIVAPTTADEASAAVAEAQQRGFTRLWIAVRPEDIALVEAAVKAGKSVGLPVGAVVRVLRAGANTTLVRDRNLFGEDSTAYVSRIAANPILQMAAMSFYGGSWFEDIITSLAQQRLNREKQWGAWLQCNDPQVQATVLGRVSAIAKIPGLAGLVLRDLHAPGYEPPSRRYGFISPTRVLDTYGYSEGNRLAFLRQYQVDPIDLGSGNQINGESYSARIDLPYFPDYGLTGKYSNGNSTYGGVNSYDMGAKDAAEKWLEFRVAVGNHFVESLVRGLRAAAPKLPLLIYPQAEDGMFVTARWITRLEDGDAGLRIAAPAPEPLQAWPTSEGVQSIAPPRQETSFQRATKDAKEVSFAIWNTAIPIRTPRLAFLQATQYWSVIAKEGWRSVTFDLSDQSVAAVPEILNGIQFVAPSEKTAGQ